MNDLFSLIKILSLDILIIDVLGYEYEILKDIEKWNILPKVIIYEDNVFMTKGEREKCTEVLISNGYKLFINDGDKVFCKLDLDQLLR